MLTEKKEKNSTLLKKLKKKHTENQPIRIVKRSEGINIENKKIVLVCLEKHISTDCLFCVCLNSFSLSLPLSYSSSPVLSLSLRSSQSVENTYLITWNLKFKIKIVYTVNTRSPSYVFLLYCVACYIKHDTYFPTFVADKDKQRKMKKKTQRERYWDEMCLFPCFPTFWMSC